MIACYFIQYKGLQWRFRKTLPKNHYPHTQRNKITLLDLALGITAYHAISNLSMFTFVFFILDFYQILKYVDLRQHPSLELGMILIFSYAPYGLAEGLKLSGKFFDM